MSRTIGLERERFIVDRFSGKVVPVIGMLLPTVKIAAEAMGVSGTLFSHELFAGQIEDRTPICSSLVELRDALYLNNEILITVAEDLNFDFSFSEFLEEEEIEELDVNPFDDRHQGIWASISQERRLAASRVIAIHVHIGASPEEALEFFAQCDQEIISRLVSLGDHSRGKRIASYKAMAQTDGVLPKFSTVASMFAYIRERGGEKNVWDLVRYKPSTQTIEFRMFGSTPKVEEAVGYAQACLQLFNGK